MDDEKRKYTNGEVTVFWNPDLCIHATTCYMELPEVFKPFDRPWVDMSAASTERIIEVVKLCPTAAIDFIMNKDLKDDELVAETPAVFEVKVKPKGPYIISGDFTLQNEDGKTLEKRSRVALCRCGASMNKPFCDGEHSFINFE